jgi:two-component system OmpR family sensor kinase
MTSGSTSIRRILALRATAAMTAAFALVAVAVLIGLRLQLDRELDASIVAVASIQASSVTDSPDGEMRFHEWELTAEEARSVTDLIRWAQVWSVEGRSLLRSQFMTSDLPVDPDALRAAGAGEIVWRQHTYEDAPVRAVYYPLDRFGPMHNEHVLQVAAPLAARTTMLTRAALLLLLVTSAVGAASFLGSWWLAGRVVRPVNEVIDQAEEIGGGSLGTRIRAYADASEYRRLVDVLNTMLGRIQRAYEVQERFAADASHELRSPLTALRGEIEVTLRRERTPEEYRTTLESALEEIDRLSRITSQLLAAARPTSGAVEGDPGPVDVERLAATVAERVAARHAERGVRIDVSATGAPSVAADSTALSQVLWNLVDNAARLSPEDGVVDVRVEVDADRVVVRVADRGPGVGPDPDRIFERFYRADPARTPAAGDGNTGLGLAIVKSLAETSGGSVAARDREGGGAEVQVVLGTGTSTAERGRV